MNWDKAWSTSVTVSAGTGIGHALNTYNEPSAWFVLICGAAMLLIFCMGVLQDQLRSNGDSQ